MARSEKFTLTRKKLNVYKDFTTNFLKNPYTGYLATLENEDSVKQSLRQLLLTDRGERFMDSDLGGDIRHSLFQNFDPSSLPALELELTALVDKYEPRAEIKEIDFGSLDLDDNTLTIKIIFTVHNLPGDQVLELSVERVR